MINDRVFSGDYPTDAFPGASIVFDNLKIWNYAKTDFSDRNDA